jgi:hypothetical protein
MICVPALSAEVHGVQTLLRIPREELLALYRDGSPSWLLESRERVTCAGNELVKLEGEKASLVRVRRSRPIALRNARDQEEASEGQATRGNVAS